MPPAVIHRATHAQPQPSETTPEFDLQINRLSVEELFALYRRAGFLYPAKAARLAPHMRTIENNWSRLQLAGDALLQVLSVGDERSGIASIASWRTTDGGWVWQHLVSERNPLHSRAVMLGGLQYCMREGTAASQQNWFRPDNRFPARVFGTIVRTLGDSLSGVRENAYFAIPRDLPLPRATGVDIVAYDDSQRAGLVSLATRTRGELYVKGETLETDVTLASVDAIYRKVGLSRTRQVWLAYRPSMFEPIGAAIAYRGPLGVNFSFLENRCDLLVDPSLAPVEGAAIAASLIEAARAAYTGFELQEMPATADARLAPVIASFGGQWLRNYCQGIWLKAGQPLLYTHIDQFYTALLARAERRSEPSTLTA